MASSDFKRFLDISGEVGYVDQVHRSVSYITGLPRVRPKEVVVFETGHLGEVLSMTEEYVEVLVFTDDPIRVGTRVTRTKRPLSVRVGEGLLGKTVDALGRVNGVRLDKTSKTEDRLVDSNPKDMSVRKVISKNFDTGVTWVDLIMPLGKGQRELVIGDRKTGKTQLLLQSMVTQAKQGAVCIYAAIAKRKMDIMMIEKFIERYGIQKSTILVASEASDPSGLIYTTPYTAMTIGEYHRDLGYDVFVILDDMSVHAKHYREISLLAKRFPGRSSYPGDIFYIHSRLLERAGNFYQVISDKTSGEKKAREVSITCMPVAELVMSDLSGYVQTNLMAMTDGHIYFDKELFDQGRRPAINPFLSVTRVGRQAQTELMRDLSRQITSFLVYLRKLREFLHFGAELSESVQRTLALGDRITAFFDQDNDVMIPKNINVFLIAALWGGLWKADSIPNMKKEMRMIVESYVGNNNFRSNVDNLVNGSKSFADLVEAAKNSKQTLSTIIGG